MPALTALALAARRRGLGATALARAAGLSRTTVWTALKTGRLPTRNGTAARLAAVLRVPVVTRARRAPESTPQGAASRGVRE
jgi:DNA-binding phage protein